MKKMKTYIAEMQAKGINAESLTVAMYAEYLRANK